MPSGIIKKIDFQEKNHELQPPPQTFTVFKRNKVTYAILYERYLETFEIKDTYSPIGDYPTNRIFLMTSLNSWWFLQLDFHHNPKNYDKYPFLLTIFFSETCQILSQELLNLTLLLYQIQNASWQRKKSFAVVDLSPYITFILHCGLNKERNTEIPLFLWWTGSKIWWTKTK